MTHLEELLKNLKDKCHDLQKLVELEILSTSSPQHMKNFLNAVIEYKEVYDDLTAYKTNPTQQPAYRRPRSMPPSREELNNGKQLQDRKQQQLNQQKIRNEILARLTSEDKTP